MALKEAAKKWHVSESTVRNWCESNTINAVKVDGIWVIASTQDSPIQNLNEFTIFGLEEAVNNFNNHYDVTRIF